MKICVCNTLSQKGRFLPKGAQEPALLCAGRKRPRQATWLNERRCADDYNGNGGGAAAAGAADLEQGDVLPGEDADVAAERRLVQSRAPPKPPWSLVFHRSNSLSFRLWCRSE